MGDLLHEVTGTTSSDMAGTPWWIWLLALVWIGLFCGARMHDSRINLFNLLPRRWRPAVRRARKRAAK